VNLPIRVLILCTGNSARSQMAEALLNVRGAGRVVAESAGSKPAARVNPWAVRALAEAGIAWEGRVPRGLPDVEQQHWDVVLTVCDNAREACPIFPGATIMAHWGQPDPADATGSDAETLAAFIEARDLLEWRVARFLELELEGSAPSVLRADLNRIGRGSPGYPQTGV
jgi:arsenate reductase